MNSPSNESRDAVEAQIGRALPVEEYVEQAHFYRTLLERLAHDHPIQETMASLQYEILATTRLPLAIEFLVGELRLSGGFAPAMTQLSHYFTPFQAFLVREAEDDRGKFDLRIALAILQNEAEYRASPNASRQGLFLFQFETLCRNRLSYDRGLDAMAKDPAYDEVWRSWLYTVRRQVGLVDLADLIFVRSLEFKPKRPDLIVQDELAKPLFGQKEGRIARASRQKDPLLLFASLQRHLGYPKVPRPKRVSETIDLLPKMARRLERLEARIKLLEDEQKGGIDLSQFMPRPEGGK